MGDGRYVISDVAKKIGVKDHTIRYWEDELDLNIERNNMGHRSYTDEDIALLQIIKQLKDSGFQLKSIKIVVAQKDKLLNMDLASILPYKDEFNQKAEEVENRKEAERLEQASKMVGGNDMSKKIHSTDVTEKTDATVVTPSNEDKMNQFKEIMGGIIAEALEKNTGNLSNSVAAIVSDNVVREMDYLMKLREEREDERFRRLDETIREVQKSRQEVAAGNANPKSKKKGFFKK